MNRKTLFALSLLVAGSAVADHYWKGTGTTSDWWDTENWINGLNDGNCVFGGTKKSSLAEGRTTVTFTNKVTIGTGIWIENASYPGIIWEAGETASDDAGFYTTKTGNSAFNLGTGDAGDLTINGGAHGVAGEMWIARGTADSQLTINGGSFTSGSYTVIAGGSSKGTLTVNGGLYKETDGKFIVSQSKNSANVGVFVQTGGEVSVPETYISENSGRGSISVSGGAFTVNGAMSAPRANGTTGEIEVSGTGAYTNTGDFRLGYGADSTGTMTLSGGKTKVNAWTRIGHGDRSKATLAMTGGEFDTDNEFVLCTGTGSEANMTLSGGVFTPKKFWVGSQYNMTSSGCTANFTMTGGTLTTDNDQDIVVGGNKNAVGTFEMKGGTVSCGNKFHIAWRGNGTLKMSGGDIYLRPDHELAFCNTDQSQSSAMELTGGTFHTDKINMSTYGTRSLTVDGGSFAPVSDQAEWLKDVPMTVGTNGLGLASGGHRATLSANLVPAEEGQSIKAVFTGADMAGEIAFAETTLAQVDAFEIAAGGVMVVRQGVTLAKPLTIAEGGKLVVDVTDFVKTDGDYDLVTLAEGSEVELMADNADLIGLPGAATLAFSVVGNVVKVNVSGLERLVLNTDGGEWTAADTWKGENSGVVRAFGAKDKAAFVIAEPDTVQTVLVNTEVTPLGVEVEATGANSHALVKGHGTFAAEKTTVTGTLAFAGDDEGALTLNAPITGLAADSKVLFASGTVNLASELTTDFEVNGKLVRTDNWAPTNLISGTGEIVIAAGKTTIGTSMGMRGTEYFQPYEGVLTIADGAVLENLTDLHAENNSQGPYYFLGEGTLLKMAGGKVARFGGATNNEYLKDVEIVDGTVNEWVNHGSRSNGSDTGVNLNITGSITGGGTLKMSIRSSHADRSYRFKSDLSTFTGTVEMNGPTYSFSQGIKGGTWIAQSDARLYADNGDSSFPVDNATLVLKNTNPDTSYTIGANAKLGTSSATTVKGISFADGATLELVDDGALSDVKTTYVAFTSATPIVGKPTLVQTASTRGKWKLVPKTVTVDETTTYQLVAEFFPSGLIIIFE